MAIPGTQVGGTYQYIRPMFDGYVRGYTTKILKKKIIENDDVVSH